MPSLQAIPPFRSLSLKPSPLSRLRSPQSAAAGDTFHSKSSPAPLRFGGEAAATQAIAPQVTKETLVLFLALWKEHSQISAPLIDKTAVLNGVRAFSRPNSVVVTLADEKMVAETGGNIRNDNQNVDIPLHAGDFIMTYGPGDQYVAAPEHVIGVYTFEDGTPLQDAEGKLQIKPGVPLTLVKQSVEIRAILPSVAHTQVLTQECMKKCIEAGVPPEGEALRPGHVVISNLEGFPYQVSYEFFLKKYMPAPNDPRAVKLFRDIAPTPTLDGEAPQRPRKFVQRLLPFAPVDPLPPDGYHLTTDLTWRWIQNSGKMLAGPEDPPTYVDEQGRFSEDPSKKRLSGVWATPYHDGPTRFLSDMKNEWMDPALCHADTFPIQAPAFMVLLMNAYTKAMRQIRQNQEARTKIQASGKPLAEIAEALKGLVDPAKLLLLRIRTRPQDPVLIRDNIHVLKDEPDQPAFFKSLRRLDPEEPLQDVGKLPEMIYETDVAIADEATPNRVTVEDSWSLQEAEKTLAAYLKTSPPSKKHPVLFSPVATAQGTIFRTYDQKDV